MLKLLQLKIGIMEAGKFEQFIRRLLPKISHDFKNIVATYNHEGKTIKGPVDLFSFKEQSKKYVAIICTTQKTALRFKIEDDIAKLSNDNCFIRDEIDSVAICINSYGKTEEVFFRDACEAKGWKVDIYYLDTLVYSANEHYDIVADLCASEIQEVMHHMINEKDSNLPIENVLIDTPPVNYISKARQYDCGHRVKEIREDLDISPSRFIDLIDFPSQKRLNELENQNLELSTIEIENICNALGLSERWLKHGETCKYEIESISTYSFEKIEIIKNWNPQSLYFLIDKETMSLALLAHLHTMNWKIFNFTFALDFWDWWGDTQHIPTIYELFNKFSSEFRHRIHGRILNTHEFNKISSGSTHPSIFIPTTNSFNSYWFDDVQDINLLSGNAANYEKWYGEWFTKIQHFFKTYASKPRI